MLAEQRRIDAELDAIAPRLVERLHALVPLGGDSARRRSLLALKRAVFNRKPLPEAHRGVALSGDAGGTLAELRRYAELLDRRRSLMDESASDVEREMRDALKDLIGAQDFRLALADASPTLARRLHRCLEDGAGRALSARECLSSYSYVCRFATKANPLHLFSRFVPGPAMRWRWSEAVHEARCEVVFDVQSLLEMERRLTARTRDKSTVRLALRPMVRRGNRWQLWLRGEDSALCVAHLPDAAVLTRLRALYDGRRRAGLAPSFTRAELVEELAQVDSEGSKERAAAIVDRLLERGVLVAYLIEDLAAPGADLRGRDEASEALVGCLARWQLACVKTADLPRLDRELRAATASFAACGEPVRYYVNSYADDDLREAERAAREIAATLRELKPLLTVEGNFAAQQRVLRAFFDEEVPEGGARPYLDLVAIFLRRRSEILDRFGWGRQASVYEAVVRAARMLHGELDRAGLDRLLALVDRRPEIDICCVGPFDFAKRQFFLTNVFAGNRASVARYVLARRRDPAAARSDAELEVELAATAEHSLNFVVPRFDAGFGFDGRWAHGYRLWIEPQDVEVGRIDGRHVYIHAPTGRALRFHYRGLLQAQYLPIEYQLLLLGHAANFHSPFVASLDAVTESEVDRQPGLFYGAVCLRREQWIVPASALSGLLGKSPVAGTVRLRDWIHERLMAEDLWYYRVPQSGRRGAKPRWLDLRSPLAAPVLARALAARPTHLLLSPMRPDWSGLWQVDGEKYVAELMVET